MPASVSLHTRPRPGRLGGLLVSQLILVELAAALVAVPLATKHQHWIVVITGPIAVILVIVAVLRHRQRWLLQWWPARGQYRRRQRGADRQAGGGGEPGIAPLLENWPSIRTVTVASRSRDSVGMIGDGTFLTAVVQVETKDEPLRVPRKAHPMPLDVLSRVLGDPEVPIASAQIVLYTQPAPSTILPQHANATRAYQALKTDAPAIRATWIALRLDPDRASGAIEARGGGTVGSQRALLKAVHAVISELDLHGFDAAPLSEPELIAALGTACSMNPLAGTRAQAGQNSRRTREERTAWRCDDRWHASYWVRRTPAFGRGAAPDLFARLTSVSTLASTLSITASAAGAGALALRVHLRVAARSEAQLAEATKQVESEAKQGGFGLVRLDGEQLPGLLATLPLGGVK